ncbi:MAG: sigma-54-dependent Fis family transcriptional regulator, partial [Acidobacteriota bacterium]
MKPRCTDEREQADRLIGTSTLVAEPVMLGGNPTIQRIRQLVRVVAPAHSTVLLSGESGVGKETVAELLHRQSRRLPGLFVRVDCSAFDDGELETELFGQEPGVEAGSLRARTGAFRRANGGTLFLDEVDDLSPTTQVKLLRVLRQREVRSVGAEGGEPIDVRLIAATDRDLAREVESGRFREDLYFALNVIPIRLPALRERPDDIPQLAEHFLHRIARESGSRARGFTERAMTAMERYAWPGNLRELQNVV